ncbi:hypothetical protein LTSEJOH_0008 [Salmonella enterica subsp. enterica serovar Johannesburg str. S5-703]|nr:hypothetical protein LTSEJOH_0008 [Salmonella enterica subsp. enterica serovar Johannesburg str. S5-703]
MLSSQSSGAPVANDTHVAEVISAPQANDTTFTDEDLA